MGRVGGWRAELGAGGQGVAGQVEGGRAKWAGGGRPDGGVGRVGVGRVECWRARWGLGGGLGTFTLPKMVFVWRSKERILNRAG